MVPQAPLHPVGACQINALPGISQLLINEKAAFTGGFQRATPAVAQLLMNDVPGAMETSLVCGLTALTEQRPHSSICCSHWAATSLPACAAMRGISAWWRWHGSTGCALEKIRHEINGHPLMRCYARNDSCQDGTPPVARIRMRKKLLWDVSLPLREKKTAEMALQNYALACATLANDKTLGFLFL